VSVFRVSRRKGIPLRLYKKTFISCYMCCAKCKGISFFFLSGKSRGQALELVCGKFRARGAHRSSCLKFHFSAGYP
jgi:hypothetical protein